MPPDYRQKTMKRPSQAERNEQSGQSFKYSLLLTDKATPTDPFYFQPTEKRHESLAKEMGWKTDLGKDLQLDILRKLSSVYRLLPYPVKYEDGDGWDLFVFEMESSRPDQVRLTFGEEWMPAYWMTESPGSPGRCLIIDKRPFAPWPELKESNPFILLTQFAWAQPEGSEWRKLFTKPTEEEKKKARLAVPDASGKKPKFHYQAILGFASLTYFAQTIQFKSGKDWLETPIGAKLDEPVGIIQLGRARGRDGKGSSKYQSLKDKLIQPKRIDSGNEDEEPEYGNLSLDPGTLAHGDPVSPYDLLQDVYNRDKPLVTGGLIEMTRSIEGTSYDITRVLYKAPKQAPPVVQEILELTRDEAWLRKRIVPWDKIFQLPESNESLAKKIYSLLSMNVPTAEALCREAWRSFPEYLKAAGIGSTKPRTGRAPDLDEDDGEKAEGEETVATSAPAVPPPPRDDEDDAPFDDEVPGFERAQIEEKDVDEGGVIEEEEEEAEEEEANEDESSEEDYEEEEEEAEEGEETEEEAEEEEVASAPPPPPRAAKAAGGKKQDRPPVRSESDEDAESEVSMDESGEPRTVRRPRPDPTKPKVKAAAAGSESSDEQAARLAARRRALGTGK